jgi:putative endonuclease
MCWMVYLLRCSDSSLYCGSTNDLQARVAKHNSGTGAKYTRSRLPVTLVWSTQVESAEVARRLEAAIKRMTKAEKESLVAAGEAN